MLSAAITVLSIYGTFCACANLPNSDEVFKILKDCVAQRDMNTFKRIFEFPQRNSHFRTTVIEQFFGPEQNTRAIQFFVDYWYLHRSRRPFAGNYVSRAFEKLRQEHKYSGINGNELIHDIILNKKTSLLRLYIDAGYEVNRQNSLGVTALHMAVDFQNEEFVDILANAGANVCLPDKNQRTPIQSAIIREEPILVNRICQKLSVSAVGYAIVLALQKNNDFIIKQVIHGVHESLKNFQTKKIFEENSNLKGLIYNEIRSDEKSSLNVKKTDWEYMRSIYNEFTEFDKWSEKRYVFLVIWKDLFQRLLFERPTTTATTVIVADFSHRTSHRHIVRSIAELYQLVVHDTLHLLTSGESENTELYEQINAILGGSCNLKNGAMRKIFISDPYTNPPMFMLERNTEENMYVCDNPLQVSHLGPDAGGSNLDAQQGVNNRPTFGNHADSDDTQKRLIGRVFNAHLRSHLEHPNEPSQSTITHTAEPPHVPMHPTSERLVRVVQPQSNPSSPRVQFHQSDPSGPHVRFHQSDLSNPRVRFASRSRRMDSNLPEGTNQQRQQSRGDAASATVDQLHSESRDAPTSEQPTAGVLAQPGDQRQMESTVSQNRAPRGQT